MNEHPTPLRVDYSILVCKECREPVDVWHRLHLGRPMVVSCRVDRWLWHRGWLR